MMLAIMADNLNEINSSSRKNDSLNVDDVDISMPTVK